MMKVGHLTLQSMMYYCVKRWIEIVRGQITQALKKIGILKNNVEDTWYNNGELQHDDSAQAITQGLKSNKCNSTS